MKTSSDTKSALPGLSPKTKRDRLKVERAQLEAVAFRLIANRRAIQMEIGSIFNFLKATLDPGCWQSYFAEAFAACGISLRGAKRWMDLAQASTRNDAAALFKPAMDSQAVSVRRATALAKAEVRRGLARRARHPEGQ